MKTSESAWYRAARASIKANLDGDKVKHLKCVYDMSLDDWWAMFFEQDGRCAICNQQNVLFVDHCHETYKAVGKRESVRALLCPSCNTLVGVLEVRGSLIPHATRYLEFYRNKREGMLYPNLNPTAKDRSAWITRRRRVAKKPISPANA